MPELLGCEPRHCRVGRALLRAAPCGPPSGHHVDPATPAEGMVFSSGCRGPQAPVAPRGTRPGSESVGPFCWPQWRPPGCELLPCVQTPDSVSLPAHLLSCQSISSPRPDIHPHEDCRTALHLYEFPQNFFQELFTHTHQWAGSSSSKLGKFKKSDLVIHLV